ncbi:TPA: 6,7-dimethyl-8-ribityllumazine synthase [Pseudomonas putida]|nr:6,7-dimethyl-8-ribityllumazine synthase [Pseudomonas putida]
MSLAPDRFAFIKANWHADIVSQALSGFCEVIPADNVDVFEVPGAFELPLVAKELALSGLYRGIAAAALVVDGGIYRHEFVAQAVVGGLMHVGLETGVPVFSISLTPHHYQNSDYHRSIFSAHFVEKGREAAQAAIQFLATKSMLPKKMCRE